MKYEEPFVKVIITDYEEEDIICSSMLHEDGESDDYDDPWAGLW